MMFSLSRHDTLRWCVMEVAHGRRRHGLTTACQLPWHARLARVQARSSIPSSTHSQENNGFSGKRSAMIRTPQIPFGSLWRTTLDRQTLPKLVGDQMSATMSTATVNPWWAPHHTRGSLFHRTFTTAAVSNECIWVPWRAAGHHTLGAAFAMWSRRDQR